ncbi:aldose epimerase family protein [Pontibacter sp. G13]|uniref:aldose epimerase family protein n=1 Tax=Pontibacter sp. G13 TaxID=3074898 RepID=UPI00288B7AEC|nr:aldose epimerase family protein [Pontibacter sp. G13]WNJ16560.1 aldose epimerase family protein [Pontibacter sp. G13]
MQHAKGLFGTHNGQDIEQFVLANDHGMQVSIMNYGATITSIKIPHSDGSLKEITCGFDTFEGYFGDAYVANAPYFGGTVGRYCSQIKDAQFSLGGETYSLAANVGNNNLHGGVQGFDKQIWQAEPFQTTDVVGVEMKLTSPHMEEGFPGNVEVTVRFSLTQDNTLNIEYQAETDQETPLALTNHTYFNLGGFEQGNEAHQVKVHASRKLQLDETGAATGAEITLDGAVDDLRNGKSIGEVHAAMNTGFEHYYLFDKEPFAFAPVAEIHDPNSGLTMEVATSEPGMLFYSGMYTSDELARENGQQFGKYRAFCCETHRYPNGPNIPGSPRSTTKPGEPFVSQTSFTFR